MHGKEKDLKPNLNKGCITNIQRFSINDGPGIRTVVFTKGCALACKWCHNPECIKPYPEIYFNELKCVKCGDCVVACPEGIIGSPSENGHTDQKIHREKCTLCMRCVEACAFGGLTRVGAYFSPEEILNEVVRDRLFYQNSGGGITVSGGEPLFQPDFLVELLKVSKKKGLHTCLDTSGFAKWEEIERVLDKVDLVLYDIKHINQKKHMEWTGGFNELILENVRRISEKVPTRLRIVIVPNFNATMEEMEEIAKFTCSLDGHVEGVDLIPYHCWAEPKYRKLDREYVFAHIPDFSLEEAKKFEEIFKRIGLETTIGG